LNAANVLPSTAAEYDASSAYADPRSYLASMSFGDLSRRVCASWIDVFSSLELVGQPWRRLRQRADRLGQAAHVVIDRDGASAKEDVQPEDRRKRAMGVRVVGGRRNRLTGERDGFIVVEAVGRVERAIDKIFRRCRRRRGCRRGRLTPICHESRSARRDERQGYADRHQGTSRHLNSID
jgi:hypothetical protein